MALSCSSLLIQLPLKNDTQMGNRGNLGNVFIDFLWVRSGRWRGGV